MYKLQSHQVAALALFSVIAAGYLVMVTWFPVAYIWGTYEDLFGEWGQTYFFATACLFSILIAVSRSPYRWFFIVLAIALFYTVMEEISWGQRIFGFESPKLFKLYNLQRETNLHNMLVGPISTDTKVLVEYTVATGLLLYGFVYPLTLRFGLKLAEWFYRKGVAAPPLYLWPFFLTAAILEFGWLSFNEAEVAEILVGFALAIMAAQYWIAHHHQIDVFAQPQWDKTVSHRLSVVIAGIFIVVISLATATTYAMYSNPAKKARIDSRLLNGYEKFAKRYSRYERWDIAAGLYLQVHEAEPKRTSVLRRLAKAYKNAGNDEQFLFYTKKALDLSLEQQKKNPNKISVNLALARTYRQLGDIKKSIEHGQRAHQLALERVKEKPDSAHWAYWLGKTYRYLKNYEAAKEQYAKAFKLKPTSLKYRKAYYEMKRATGE